MVPKDTSLGWLVGRGINLPEISCQKFWYAIRTTRRLWKVSWAKNPEMAKKNPLFLTVFCSLIRPLDLF